MARQGLARAERVVKAREYRRTRDGGRRVHGKWFILNYLERQNAGLRLGLVVSKRVGKAAPRNLVKRRLREFFRLNKHRIGEELARAGAGDRGVDLVFVAKPGAAGLTKKEAELDLAALVKRMVKNIGPEVEKAGDRDDGSRA